MITEKVQASLEELNHILAIVNGQMESNHCSMKTKSQLDLAVEEAFVNIISYAYAPEAEHQEAEISMEIEGDPAMMVVTLKDRGVPCNPLERKDPDVSLPADQRSIGGLGVFLMRRIVKDVTYRYEDGQNVLTITKELA